jgi:hybrid cluster-associated redox disulfide protein
MITADTLIADVIAINEEAGEILMDFGMHCLGCAIAHQETVGQAAMVHGIDLDKLLEALNK